MFLQLQSITVKTMSSGFHLCLPVDFEVYGGVYRDVKLVLTDRLYIPMQGSAIHEGGTFVTTPRVSEMKAWLEYRPG